MWDNIIFKKAGIIRLYCQVDYFLKEKMFVVWEKKPHLNSVEELWSYQNERQWRKPVHTTKTTRRILWKLFIYLLNVKKDNDAIENMCDKNCIYRLQFLLLFVLLRFQMINDVKMVHLKLPNGNILHKIIVMMDMEGSPIAPPLSFSPQIYKALMAWHI